MPLWAIFYACHSQGAVIKGTIDGAANLQVTLEQAHFDRSNVAIGKSTCDGSGKFSFDRKEGFPEGFYRLSIGAKRMYFILDGKEKAVDIKGAIADFDRMNVTVTGSETFACYAKIIKEAIDSPAKDANGAKEIVKKGCTPLTQAFLAVQLLGNNAGAFLEDLKGYQTLLTEKMPGTKYAADYAKMIGDIEGQLAEQQAGEAIKVGQPAPDIALPGPDGKVHKLSDLKGKVVLLDFWASWCGPCRRENPNVVQTYNKYHAKGFDILGVSLDTDAKRWRDAIKQDGLPWHHISDLGGWQSKHAALYSVSSIPTTVLVDKEGRILARNLRGEQLGEKLKEIFGE